MLISMILNIVGTLTFVVVVILLYRAVAFSTVAISPVSVPKEFVEKGYVGEVVAQKLQRSLLKIILNSRSYKAHAGVIALADEPSITVPQTNLPLELLASELCTIFSVENYWRVNGNITDNPNGFTATISINNSKGVYEIKENFDKFDNDSIFESIAQSIMQIVDPYILAASFGHTDPDKAIIIAKSIIAQNNADSSSAAWSHVLIGGILLNNGKLDAAYTELKSAIALDDHIAVAHNNLGNILKTKGDTKEAILEYRKSIMLDPNFAPPHDGLGEVFRGLGETDKAELEFELAIALDSKWSAPHINLGVVHLIQGKIDYAIADFEKGVALDPNAPAWHVNLGSALKQKGNIEEAILEFRKAIALDPNDPNWHISLGDALKSQNRVLEAEEEFKKASNLKK